MRNRNIFLGVTFLFATLAFGVSPIMAEDKTDPTAAPAASTQQMLCNKRSEVMKNLSANYKEAPTALGMASSGGVLEVMTSKDGKTWTVLLTKTDGTSCLVAMGNSWENVKYIAAGPSM
jgi:hypothetical protein